MRLCSEARPPPNISKERKAGKTQTGRRTNRRDNRKRKKVMERESERECNMDGKQCVGEIQETLKE